MILLGWSSEWIQERIKLYTDQQKLSKLKQRKKRVGRGTEQSRGETTANGLTYFHLEPRSRWRITRNIWRDNEETNF